MARAYPPFAVIDGGRPDRRPRSGRRIHRPWWRKWLLGLVTGLGLVLPEPLTNDLPPKDPLSVEPAPTCRVVSVTDGDTIRIWCPARGTERARLVGFDTPELFSPRCAAEYRAARAAKSALSRLIGGATEIGVVLAGTDRYGRALVELFVDGSPVSRAMIDAGHARPYMGGERQGWCGSLRPWRSGP